ncbi:MAG: tRNA lysidine(34) synthetase TilS [Oscillospiraceae bacterium]|nr:tRNA lysidine(34) synthetase TilS [Oscillospiraceae bacterium]
MRTKVVKTINKFNMLKQNDNILVALSGGADSVTLLHLLNSLKEYSFNIWVCHVNHQIRGQEAQRDEDFVRILCKNLSIPLFVETINVPELSRKNGKSLEEMAREVRYNIFNKLASKLNAKIATAHTLNDSIETVILNLTRGTGLKGLCGIPAKRGKIIRPLIEISRTQIEEYIKDNHLDFVNDSTNNDLEYKRNRIRHEIMPKLFIVNPSFAKVFKRMYNNLTADEEFLQNETLKAIKEIQLSPNKFYVSKIKNLPASIKFRSIKEILTQVNILCDAKKIELIEDAINIGFGKINLHNDIFCIVRDDVLSIEKIAKESKENDFTPIKIVLPGEYKVSRKQKLKLVAISIQEYNERRKNSNLIIHNAIDFKKTNGDLLVRFKVPGDSIKLNGRNCTKTLKKLFNEYKLPQKERESCLVLADNEGPIWVNGFGVAQRVALDEKTKEVLLIEVER